VTASADAIRAALQTAAQAGVVPPIESVDMVDDDTARVRYYPVATDVPGGLEEWLATMTVLGAVAGAYRERDADRPETIRGALYAQPRHGTGNSLHGARPTATWEAEADWFRRYTATGDIEQLVERVVDANEDLQGSEEWARDRLTGTSG